MARSPVFTSRYPGEKRDFLRLELETSADRILALKVLHHANSIIEREKSMKRNLKMNLE